MNAQSIVEQSVLQVAQQLEQQIDSELHKLDNLQDDDIEALRQRRLLQLKRQQEKQRQWLERGHGEYRDLQSEKEFFKEMKGEERMVCHFYRGSYPCKIMDKHLAILTKQHLETKFAKINAEQSPFLTDKLGIWMLPTLALIKNEKTVDYVVGFDELGGKEDFATESLAIRLGRAGIINYEEPAQFVKRPQETKSVRKGGPYNRSASDEDSDFDD